MRSLKSHSAEIHKNRDPLGFLALLFAAKYQENLKVGPFEGKKIESHTVPKKIERGPFSLVRFCRLRKNSKKRKGGPFCTNFR